MREALLCCVTPLHDVSGLRTDALRQVSSRE